MRVFGRRRLPLPVFYITIIFGVASSVYIWQPSLKQLHNADQLLSKKEVTEAGAAKAVSILLLTMRPPKDRVKVLRKYKLCQSMRKKNGLNI